MLYLHQRRLSPTAPAGTPPPAGGATTPAPGTQPETPTDDAPGSEGTPAERTAEEKSFTQADLDRIVKERLEREREKAAKAEAKARKEAEMSALAQQQEWQTLAAKRQEALQEIEERLRGHEDLEAKLEKYTAALTGFLKAQLAGVPDHVADLLKDRDPVDQFEWLTANRDKFGQQSPPPLGGTPPPQGAGRLMDEERRKKAFRPRL